MLSINLLKVPAANCYRSYNQCSAAVKQVDGGMKGREGEGGGIADSSGGVEVLLVGGGGSRGGTGGSTDGGVRYSESTFSPSVTLSEPGVASLFCRVFDYRTKRPYSFSWSLVEPET